MSSTGTTADDVTFEQVLVLAQRLRTVDQARLVARLAPKVEWVLNQVEPIVSSQSRTPLRGLLADLGPAPSAEDIDEVQREMWATLTQE
ncbi:MAG: hypothetical protein ACK2U9_24910 [Anaerolineae bacterium]|jgi:hypothetical protein